MADHFLLMNMRTKTHVPLVAESVTLGRQQGCEILLESSEASRRHARITVKAGGLTLEDLGSTNGTLLNRRRLLRAEVLGGGDIISIGQAHFMVVAPGSDTHATLPGGRLAATHLNFVLDQDSPDATGLHMPFPMPPGWKTQNDPFKSNSSAPSPMARVGREMARQSIGKENTDGVLMITSNKGRNTLFPLRSGKTAWVIGRSGSSDVAISEATLSAAHALITRESGQWFVEDRDSTNGTRLNGQTIDKARLDNGGELTLGKVSLLFASVLRAAASD